MSDYADLKPELRMFVDSYVNGAISAQDAVIEAGFAQFEDITPHEVAMRLMSSKKIQAAIEERVAVLHDKGIADVLWFLRRLVDYANVDYTEMFHPNGFARNPREWPKPLRMMIRNIKMDPSTGMILSVTFEPKTKIYELIGRTDLMKAFEHENEAQRTVVLVRNYTTGLEENEVQLIDAEVESGLADSHDPPVDQEGFLLEPGLGED